MQTLLIATVIVVLLSFLLWLVSQGRVDLRIHLRGTGRSEEDPRVQEDLAAQLKYQVQHDVLTGLPNRGTFLRGLDEVYASAVDGGLMCAVMVLHINRLERINENYGYAVGDELLKETTRLLQSQLKASDVIGRTGSREFTIALASLTNASSAEAAARQILRIFDEPIAVSNHSMVISASIGLAVFPEDSDNASDLLRDATRAQCCTKDRGADNLIRLSRRLSQKAQEENRIESLIQNALAQGAFEVHYQPISDIRGELCALEALIRMRDGNGKFVSPDAFIPIAESSGTIIPIGRWVTREVCRQLKQWQGEGLKVVPVAINASALQIVQSNFCADVLSILKEFEVSPGLVHMELTESGVMPRESLALDNMLQLSEAGIRFSIDDFGTGFSSLDRLHQLPVSTLKIDQTFVARMLDQNGTLPIVATIISMAHSLNLGVVAEGVETREQFCALYEMGCDQFQGYLLGRPVNASAAVAMLPPAQRTLLPGQEGATLPRSTTTRLGTPLC